MKLLVLFGVILPLQLFSQVDLKSYCPSKFGQDGAVCFAYAPVYTALSIEHNIENNISDENDPNFKVFSYGFVASKVKKNKSFFGRLFNRCGRNATVDMSLDVLKKDGTVLYNDFPESCNCDKVDGLLPNAKTYKIKNFQLIGDDTTIESTHIQNIKNALITKKPVIIALLQESFFYNNEGKDLVVFPNGYEINNTSANHVICIVGFNDSKYGGSFIVKNNYTTWGVNGFSHVKYIDMIKLIRGSYIITI